MTTSKKQAAPFVITGPGKYVDRRGRSVLIVRHCPDHNFPWKTDMGVSYRDGGAVWITMPSDDDIIARAPSHHPKPKAKRRYVVVPVASHGYSVEIKDPISGDMPVAMHMSRSIARRLCKMLNGEAK